MTEQLREVIEASGQSLNQLSKTCGVDSGRLSRFMREERGLSQKAIDSIWKTLGLRIVAPNARATGAEES